MIVPASLYASAVTWRSSIWQLGSVLGPAIGGLLFAFSGPLAKYAVVLTLIVIAFGGMWMVQVPARRANAAPVRTAGAGMLQGVRFVMRDKLVLAALSLDMFAVLFGGATALLPVFTDTVLHVSPQWLGYRRASPAAGAVVMAVNSIFIGSANEIGAFESGVTAKLFGAVNSVLLGGVVTLAVVLGMTVLSPTLRQLGRLHEAADDTSQ